MLKLTLNRPARLRLLALRFLVAGLVGGVAAAAAHTAMGPDLAAMRADERQKLVTRQPPPPRNIIRETDSRRSAARRIANAADPRTEAYNVLDGKALAAYGAILKAINNRQFEKADKAIAALENKLLLGFVLARRYIASGAKPTYAQLVAWLKNYADRPAASTIYKLALKLKPRNQGKPPSPAPRGNLQRFKPRTNGTPVPRPQQSRRARRFAIAWERRFRRHLKRDRITAAARMLEQKAIDKTIGGGRLDLHRTMLANRLLQLGKSKDAFELAQPAADRTGDKLAQAHWLAGLAAWHQGKNGRAAHHFSQVALRKDESDWLRAAGAYWAARAFTQLKDPSKAKLWLQTAAAIPRTFYGVLARHRLSMQQGFTWSTAAPAPEQLAAFKKSDAGQRALALIQLEQPEAAASTLLRLYIAGGEKLSGTFAMIAEYGRLTTLAYIFAGRHYRRSGKLVDVALYPVPDWSPDGGFKLDRALIFAVMRQESAFKTRARSSAGARGLMQLMPATAAFISNDRSLRRRHVDRLYTPGLNMALGQKFLRHLLGRSAIQGNLFFAVAAYNAGEGNLAKWKVRDDPLLFIETIHLYETRGYVERVLYNLWAYRMRLGQNMPSLAALAQNKWPQYVALDGKKSNDAAKKKKDQSQ
jgi:soluble lytic murein transglycosylase